MGCARYVGRVGALAVALGIGAGVANGPSVAWADGDDGSSSGSTSSTSSASTSSDSTGSSSEGAGTGSSTGSESGSSVGSASDGSSSGADQNDDDAGGEDDDEAGAETEGDSLAGETEATQPTAEPEPSPVDETDAGSSEELETVDAGSSRRQVAPTPDADVNVFSTVVADSTVANASAAVVDAGPVVADAPISARTVQATADFSAPQALLHDVDPATAPADEQAPVAAVTGLMSWLALHPLFNGGPADAPDMPLAWAVFAALRRLTDEEAGTEQKLTSVADPMAATMSLEESAMLAATPVYELDSSISMGSGPTGLAVTPDGSHVYVADRFTKSVYVVDSATRTVEATIPMGAGPNAVAISPDGSRAYVGLHGVNKVAVIDTTANTMIGTINVGPGATEIAVTPDGSRLYVTNTSGRTVSVVDTASRTEITRVAVGSSPMGVTVTPDGSKVYVANRYSNSVSVIDTATNKVIATVKVGSSPRSVAITPDGSHAYVTNAGPNTLSVINTATNTVVATVAVQSDPIGVAVSPDGAYVYAANSNDRVSVIDTATNTVVHTFAVDPKPETGVHYIAAGPDGTLYVTDTRDKTLRVVTATSAEPMMAMLSAEEVNQPMMALVAANSGPSASPTVGLPEPVGGVVTGSLNATDPESNPLTYAVQTKSFGADVQINSAGTFTYTPSEAMRWQAATTSVMDTDTFTVRISDGQTFTDVPVTVVVRPSRLVGQASVDVDRDPSAIAVNADGTRAYVANKYDRTVQVIDTADNRVLATIKVPSAPSAVIVSPVAGQNRAYVATSAGVAVIDTSTNKVVDLKPSTTTVDMIKVGAGPTALAMNPTGTRMYVSNGGSSTVSVVDTATNLEITRVSVGSQPSGVAVSPDGMRVYALSRYTDKVTVFSATSNQVIGSAAVGDSPRGIVLSANGQTAYVSNYNSGTVTVLNTSANTPTFVKTISVGTQPEGIAMSKDGTLVYVANGKDTLSVIDTRTNMVVGSAVPIDAPAESGVHAIAVAGNRIYVTDYVDDWVRVLNVGSLMTPPQSIGAPTQSQPDQATGAVSGDFMVRDTDGDQLSWSVIGTPTKGNLTINPNGTYTYTPTEFARQQAGPNTTDTFSVRASDGFYTKDVTLTVPVLALTIGSIPVTVTTVNTTQPAAIAVRGGSAYVYSNGTGTVSVIDTSTNTVKQTTPVRSEPDAVSPDGARRYVARNENWGMDMYVDVIDNATGNVVTTVNVPTCSSCAYGYTLGIEELVVSPDGTRVYARHDYATEIEGISAVTIIDAATNTVLDTRGFLEFSDMDFAQNGSLYAADYDYYYPDVVVLDSDLNQISSIRLTPPVGSLSWTESIGTSVDGTLAYVTVYDSDARGYSYSVIDTTTNTEIAAIVERTSALSPDGSRRYVLQSDGKTVNVYDAATNGVVGSFVTDQNASTGARSIVVGADGKVYITDAADSKVYVVTVGSMPSAV